MTGTVLSLRLRLFAVILGPLLVASLGLGAWRYQVAQATSQDLFDRGLLAAALAISRDVAISGGDALSVRTREFIAQSGGGEVFYHVTGPGGIYITGYAYPPPWPGTAPDGGPEYTQAEYRGEPVRVLRMAETTTIDDLTGPAVVTVWQRLSDRDAFASDLARRAFLLIGALMAILAIVVWNGVGFGLRPLRGLQEAIERRSPDDLTPIGRAVPIEVTGIVATLNRLFFKMDRSIEAHQSFISDAAHQLRNPASALLSLAETLPSVTDHKQRADREQELIRAARKSAKLAQNMLSLERLRHGAPPDLAPLNLASLTQEVATDQAADFLAREIEFSFDGPDQPMMVRGDATLLSEALRNLLDNALQHGGEALGKVAVRLARDGERAVLSVEDDGRGVSTKDADKAFQRFGQLEPSEGSGLGLAIVKEVMALHGGDVRLQPADQGVTFKLAIPLQV